MSREALFNISVSGNVTIALGGGLQHLLLCGVVLVVGATGDNALVNATPTPRRPSWM